MKSFPLSLLVLSLLCMKSHAVQQTELQNQFKDPILSHAEKINYPEDYFTGRDMPTGLATASFPISSAEKKLIESDFQSATESKLSSVLELFDLGDGIGFNGAFSGDYNGDGITELVLAGPTSISVVEYRNKQFTPITQLNFPIGMHSLVQFHDAGTDNDYLFFISGNSVFKLNLVTRQIEAIETVQGADSLILAELNGLNTPELLVRNNSGAVKVYDPAAMKLLTSLSGLNSKFVAAGSFTAKAKSELVLQDGSIYRLENNTAKLEKKLSTALGSQAKKIDVNSDGLDDLIISYGWYRIAALDLNLDSLIWTKSTSLDISTFVLADADQDGKTDVVYGHGQWGALHAFNMQTTETFWTIGNPNHGVTGIIVADLDNDKSLDIGWGGGYSSSGGDYYYIHDVKTRAAKWTSPSLDFPAQAVQLADVDNDGDLDALYATPSSSSGYSGAQMLAYDLTSKKMLWQISAAPNNWSRTIQFRAGDFDKDGKTDIAVGASEIYTATMWLYNGKDGSLKAKQTLGDGDKISGMAVADVNSDGLDEIIFSTGAQHTGSVGTVLTAHSPIDGKKLKTSPVIDFSWNGMHSLTSFSFTGRQDEVFGMQDGALYQYSFTTNTIKKIGAQTNLSGLTAATMQGEPALFAVTDNNQLVRINDSGTTTNIAKLCDYSVKGLSTAGPARLVYGCSGEIVEYNLDTKEEMFRHYVGGDISAAPVVVRHQQKDFYIVPGSKVSVLQSGVQQVLPTPAPVALTTHVLKTITGTLKVDGDADYFVLKGTPQLGKFNVDDRKAGTFSYLPSGNLGKESISFYAVKGTAFSEPASLTIDVTNQAPIASNLNISTHWNKAVNFKLPAKDDDGETLKFYVLSQPEQGTVQMDGSTGNVLYTPSSSTLSPVSFSFHAKDTLATSETKNVVISLTNTTPKASPVSYVTSFETPVNGALKGTDDDNDELSYSLASQPAAGTLTLDAKTGLFVYTPSGDTDQQISFSYQVKDKFATSESQSVTIQVKGKPKPIENKPVESKSGGNFAFIFSAMLLVMAMARRQFVR